MSAGAEDAENLFEGEGVIRNVFQDVVTQDPVERVVWIRDRRHIDFFHIVMGGKEVAADITGWKAGLDFLGEIFLRSQMQDAGAFERIPKMELIKIQKDVPLAVVRLTGGTPEMVKVATDPLYIVQVGGEGFPPAPEGREGEKMISADAARVTGTSRVEESFQFSPKGAFFLSGMIVHCFPLFFRFVNPLEGAMQVIGRSVSVAVGFLIVDLNDSFFDRLLLFVLL